MASVEVLRERLEVEYLEPVTEQSPQVPITAGINTTATTITHNADVLSPDEIAGIGPSTVMELNNELLFVTAYNEATRTLTVNRNHLNSGAASHSAGDYLRFPTRWPRYVQTQAIRDAIEGLYPPLYVVKELRIPTDALGYVELPLETVALLEVIARYGSRWLPVQAELFQSHGLDGEQAGMQVEVGVANVMSRIRYGKRLVLPTDNSQTVDDLPTRWERLVMVDAAINLMSGVDIDAVSQEYLTESLRLERFPVRSGESIVKSLIQLREYLMNRFMNEQKALDPPMVRNVDTVVYEL